MRALITQRFTNTSVKIPPPAAGVRDAAVLLPLMDRAQTLSVLLTQRTQHLHNHAGQISLPGGIIETTDAGPVAAALRETEEEIGISPAQVDVVGQLDAVETFTGFRIMPVVGFVAPDIELRLDRFEVESAFEVPLDFIVDPRNYALRTRQWRNQDVSYYVLNYEGRVIWGATAEILASFVRRLGLAGSS